MEAFALYLFRSVVWLTGFALVYLLFLRNERYFLLNRIYLLAGITASILFPFFTWHYTVLIPVTPTVEVSELQMTGVVMEPEAFPIESLLFYAYLAGALYLLYRITRQTVKVIGIIRQSEILPYRSAKLIRTPLYPASFSFFSFVFVNPSSSETETREIVNHELEHVRQRHWIDLVLFELLCTLQWLNPMVWLYGRFIRQNHEFLADQHALQRSANPAIYRAALINQLFGGEVISLANSFSYSINKKRFHMMKNTINPPIRKLKLLLILPIMAAVFYAFATPEYKYVNANEDFKPTSSVINGKIQISFTNQLTKTDLENIKADFTKLGIFIDYSMLDFTDDGKLKSLSATVKTEGGSVSFGANISDTSYPVFQKEPTGEFGVYFTGIGAGKILKPDGSPLEGAAVVIAGTNIGTITSKDGQFQLKDMPKDAELVISHVGYENVKVKPDEGQPTIINMTPANKEVGEITVTGYGISTGQYNLGTSLKLQTNSPLKFGNPDGSSAQPLIVVDGVIADNQNVNNISPETIESINVFKNEHAVSKYGDKGKNGVIEIYTKKEASGSQNNLIDVNIQQEANAQKGKDVFTVVEQMPEFPGGDAALRNFIAQSVKYPAAAQQKGAQGKVYVMFVVTKTGTVTNARIVRGADPSLDKEALRVVNSLPTWKPGKQGGKNVDVEYTIPINFVLQGNPKKSETATLEGSPIFFIVEEMPTFPGGDAGLRSFIASNVKYPAEARQNGIQGKVYVNFVVAKTGKVTNAKIARGVDPSLDQEAIRVVESLPAWTPGKQGGTTVDVYYTVPINFVLEGDTRKSETSTGESPVFFIVEEMPTFPGGDAGLRNFIASNVKYPAMAAQEGIQGKVYISFVVTKTGKVTNAKVARGVDPSLDQEAIRVVESLPAWTPGKQKGVPVDVAYTVPINFVLDNEKPIFTVVEQMPEFPGGVEALKAYIASNVKYPVIALENGISGQVYVSFVVSKTGSIPSAKIVRGVDPSLDKEALRVVNSMPKWNPGKQNGEAVDVEYTLPIEFSLPKDYKKILNEKLRTPYNTSKTINQQNVAQAGKLVIVPNPTNSRATVTLEGTDYSGKLQVSLFDIYGKLVRKESKNGPSFSLSVNSLTPGTYLVVTSDGSKQYQGHLVVSK